MYQNCNHIVCSFAGDGTNVNATRRLSTTAWFTRCHRILPATYFKGIESHTVEGDARDRLLFRFRISPTTSRHECQQQHSRARNPRDKYQTDWISVGAVPPLIPPHSCSTQTMEVRPRTILTCGSQTRIMSQTCPCQQHRKLNRISAPLHSNGRICHHALPSGVGHTTRLQVHRERPVGRIVYGGYI